MPQAADVIRLMAGTTGLEPATSAVTGQRSDQLSYVPRCLFRQLGYMSHRIKRFAAFALFALFYHFAAVDSILGFYRHQTDTKMDTKTATATTESSLPDQAEFGVQFALSQSKSFVPCSTPRCSRRALAGDSPSPGTATLPRGADFRTGRTDSRPFFIFLSSFASEFSKIGLTAGSSGLKDLAFPANGSSAFDCDRWPARSSR